MGVFPGQIRNIPSVVSKWSPKNPQSLLFERIVHKTTCASFTVQLGYMAIFSTSVYLAEKASVVPTSHERTISVLS